ncbi:MAG: aminoglycoside phosphotransferase family protein [Oscillospiraceae bacterium]
MDDYQVRTLFRRHKLEFGTIEPAGAGFRNEVYLSDDYVLKVYPEHNRTGFMKEHWFYSAVKPAFAPELIAAGEDYLIFERIRGKSLFTLWRDMAGAKRLSTVSVIAKIMRTLSTVDYAAIAGLFPVSDDYGAKIFPEIAALLMELLERESIPEALAHRVKEYCAANLSVFRGEPLCLVHGDMHFDNFMLADNGKLYLIDYEMLEIAPKDYDLDVWQRMMLHPFIYAGEADHALTVPADYRELMKLLKMSSSDLFLSPTVKDRVTLYGIRYELAILKDYPMDALVLERLTAYLDGMDWNC